MHLHKYHCKINLIATLKVLISTVSTSAVAVADNVIVAVRYGRCVMCLLLWLISITE